MLTSLTLAFSVLQDVEMLEPPQTPEEKPTVTITVSNSAAVEKPTPVEPELPQEITLAGDPWKSTTSISLEDTNSFDSTCVGKSDATFKVLKAMNSDY